MSDSRRVISYSSDSEENVRVEVQAGGTLNAKEAREGAIKQLQAAIKDLSS